MKVCLIFILTVAITGSVISYNYYPTEIPNKYICPSVNAEREMKYHGTPTYYWTLTGSNFTLAGYFEPEKFGVKTTFRIKKIGFMGYLADGYANLYIFLAETKNHPDCTPPEFSKKKYGPYYGHINNSYPKYDDLDVSSIKWIINNKDIDSQPYKRFWVIYNLPTSPPPYPISDESTNAKNSMTYYPGTGWTNTLSGYYPCWCMHVIVEYLVSPAIENTSFGTVKSLFK